MSQAVLSKISQFLQQSLTFLSNFTEPGQPNKLMSQIECFQRGLKKIICTKVKISGHGDVLKSKK